MQSPYILHAPISQAAPLVFDSPHSGTQYPDDFKPALPINLLRDGEDCFVDQLFAAAPAAGATLLTAQFPRIYIDPNRSMLDIDQALLEQEWPGPVQASRKTELGIGLIWRLSQHGQSIYNRKLSHAEVMHRLQSYHQPYQKALKGLIDKNVQQFGSSWHINCHSMAAFGSATSDDVGVARADFVLGDRDHTTCDRDFTYLIYGFLRGQGYTVKVNEPYKGVELVRAFSDPAEHRHSIQVEVNQRLYLNEHTRERNEHFLSLQADLTKLISMLAQYTAEQAHHVEHHCDHAHHHHHSPDHDHHHEDSHGHSKAHNHRHDDHAHHEDKAHSHDHVHDHDHKHEHKHDHRHDHKHDH
jgi:N-formylglutamate deformylase